MRSPGLVGEVRRNVPLGLLGVVERVRQVGVAEGVCAGEDDVRDDQAVVDERLSHEWRGLRAGSTHRRPRPPDAPASRGPGQGATRAEAMKR